MSKKPPIESAPDAGLVWHGPGFTLDETRRELRCGGELVAIEPKPLDLLMLLLRHPGELVTKEELFEHIWAGRVVTDSVLTRCVAKLRAALGEQGQALIVNLHGYGYRYAGALCSERPPAPAVEAPPPDSQPGLRARPGWQLERLLDARGLTWLAREEASGALRVYKFARDARGLAGLKREVTVHRLLRETLPGAAGFVPLLDWSLDAQPAWLELPYHAAGSLKDWAAAQGGLERLPLAQRLELLAGVAESLGQAHQAGVLHKDLKPANLLVISEGGGVRLCIADFGSARIDPAALRQMQLTRLGYTQTQAELDSLSGTPLYLAPELFEGQPPSPRSDIYSLGVLLYQWSGAGFARPLAPGWEREVQDELLREDISACCDTDPARRLDSAAHLAQRLRALPQRRREREQAQADHARVQAAERELRRLRARRNLYGAVAATFLLGFVLSFWQYLRVVEARDQAHAQAQRAERMSSFLNDEVLDAANPYQRYIAAGPREISMRDMLQSASTHLDDKMRDDPPMFARLSATIGDALQNLGLEEQAAARLYRSLEYLDGLGPAQAAAADQVRSELADLEYFRGHFQQAETHWTRMQEFRTGHYGADDLRTYQARSGLARLQYEYGHYAESATRYEALLGAAQARAAQDEDYADFAARLRWYLAEPYIATGRAALAEVQVRAALAHHIPQMQPESIMLIRMHYTLGQALLAGGHPGEAHQLLDTTTARATETLGAGHPYTLFGAHWQAVAALGRGEAPAAVAQLRRVLQGRSMAHGAQHPRSLASALVLGEALLASGAAAEAEQVLREGLAGAQQSLGQQHVISLEFAAWLGLAQAQNGETQAGQAAFHAALAQARAQLPAQNPRLQVLEARAQGLQGPDSRSASPPRARADVNIY